MNSSKEYKENLILKHLRKETSPVEEKELAEWLKENPDNQALYKEVCDIWNLTSYEEEFEPDVLSAWESVKRKANLNTEFQTEDSKGKNMNVKFDFVLKIAASILLLGVLTWVFLPGTGNEIATISLHSEDEQMEFLLPDGSTVWLNKHSSLSFKEGFSNGREVKLDGEAFFEIQRDTLKPFSVIGNLSRTTVLGTSFNVNTRGIEEIEVYSGRVAFALLENESEPLILEKGSRAIAESGHLHEQKVHVVNAASWKDRQLAFSHSTLAEVVESFEKYFGVQISLEQRLANCPFTGTFDHPSLEESLQVLEVAMEVQVQKNKDSYSITGPGCPQ